MSDKCCPSDLPAFQSDYKPLGQTVKLTKAAGRALETYVYQPGGKVELGIIYYADVFGLLPNALQGADLLARSLNARVYVPDLYEGQPWETSNMPPKEGYEAMFAHFGKVAPPEKIRELTIELIEQLRGDGIERVGAIGFCLGAKLLAANSALVGATAYIHPSGFTVEEAKGYRGPVALLPSQDEDKELMKNFWAALSETAKKDGVFQTFPVHHGFAAGRSDWNDPELGKHAHEAFELAASVLAKA